MRHPQRFFVHTMPRRRFLRGVGVGLLAAPFYRLLEARADTALNARFISVATPMGHHPDWRPRNLGPQDFQLGPVAQSLEPFRDKLTYVLDLKSTYAQYSTFGAHRIGYPAGVCPTLNFNENRPTSESIEQYLVDRWATPEPVRSLSLGVLSRKTLSYGPGGQPIQESRNAQSVFNTLFADISGGEDEVARLRAQRKSVMDSWTAELGHLKSELGSAHRHALDAHLTQIRGLETLLDAGMGDCSVPGGIEGSAEFYETGGNMPIIGQQMTDLIVAAFSCGLTRAATLAWSYPGSMQSHINWAGAGAHHPITHAGNVESSMTNVAKIDRWYTEQFAYLLGQLDAIPDGDGTLLDNTLVYWTSETGHPRSHAPYDMSILLAGNPGGYFASGRGHQFPGVEDEQRWLNSLMAEMATGLGVPTERFGEVGGQLPEIRA